jgi:hypothetical protein
MTCDMCISALRICAEVHVICPYVHMSICPQSIDLQSTRASASAYLPICLSAYVPICLIAHSTYTHTHIHIAPCTYHTFMYILTRYSHIRYSEPISPYANTPIRHIRHIWRTSILHSSFYIQRCASHSLYAYTLHGSN